MDELLTALAAGDGDELFSRYLLCASRFTHYSSANVGLIMLQAPTATRVAGRKTWLSMNRRLRKGSKAIWVYAPTFHYEKLVDEQTGETTTISHRHFVLVPLFDLSATEVISGHTDLFVPSFNRDLGSEVEPLIIAATAWAGSVGYRLEFRPLFRQVEGLGYAARGGRIAVDSTITANAQLPTLTHEISHQRLAHLDRKDIDRSLAEGEAEATSCIVLNYFGFASSASPAYLSNHRVTAERVKGSLKRITQAAADIIDGIESHLPSSRQEEPTVPAPIEASP